jgi:hypothetical protein
MIIQAAEFIRALDNNKNLFIIYYGGHRRIINKRQAGWTYKRDLINAKVHWSAIQTLFTKAKSDVLILLNTCAATSAIMRSQHGSIEAIMAYGFKSRALLPGEY